LTPLRLVSIAAIYFMAAFAWFALGTSLVARTGEFDGKLSREVALLWGGKHVQVAPDACFERPRTVTEEVQQNDSQGRVTTRQVTRTVTDCVPIPLDSSQVDVALHLDHRQKGLLWYDTYTVCLRAAYRLRNPDTVDRTVVAHLAFPSGDAIYDKFQFRINGEPARLGKDPTEGVRARVVVPAGGDATLDLAYDSRGLDDWKYALAASGVTEVRNFVLTMKTDFDAIDFPAGTISPTAKTRTGNGWDLRWTFASLVTGQHIGLDLPNKPNPGPLAARITYFAPVGLLFFLTVMVILGVLNGRSLHPMNYAFLAAAFFAFHLLLAYLVDHLQIHAAFVLASATSVLLVVSYLRLVAGARFAIVRAGMAQLVFLVLFSYAFFFEGYTGLTVTIGAVLTLFVLMQVTARVDWGAVLGGTPTEQRS
jgi:Inner membrane protein CreD